METVRSGIRLVGSTVAHAAVGVGAGSVAAVSTVLPSAGGAVDVIAVKQPDGTLRCSPFYVRFGKYQGLIRGREKVVTVTVNGELSEFTMRLGRNGKAFFVEPLGPRDGDGDDGAASETTRSARDPAAGFDDSEEEEDDDDDDDEAGEPGAADDERAPVAVALQPTESGGVSVAIVTSARAGDRDATAGAEGKKPPREAPDTASEISPPPTTRAPAREAESAWSWLAWSSFSTSSAPAETPSSASPRERSDPPAEALAAAPPPAAAAGETTESPLERFDSVASTSGRDGEAAARLPSPPPSPAVSRSSSVSDGGVDSAPPPSAAAASLASALLPRLELSLCGADFERFDDHRVPRAAFLADPAAFAEDPALAVRPIADPAGGARPPPPPLPWRAAAPHALAHLAFRAPLPASWNVFPPAEAAAEGAASRGAYALKDGFETDSREASQHGASCFSPDSLASGGSPEAPREGLGSPPAREREAARERGPRRERGDEATSPRRGRGRGGFRGGSGSRRPAFRRSVTLGADQIARLGLRPGKNALSFAFSSRVWGRQEVRSHAYLWDWDAKVVVSDVDGTITKSDVLGHLAPVVGRDWNHAGVAQLYNNIRDNGYQVMFLSSRAISQSKTTRRYLEELTQDGETLTQGPVMLAPDSLSTALYREVVVRRPQEFKMRCLRTIRDLFPEEWNPFYAGFGNRDTDVVSYAHVGVPDGRNFTINPKSEVVAAETKTRKTWTLGCLNELVHEMFPPTRQGGEGGGGEGEETRPKETFSDVHYWKREMPRIADEDLP